MLKRKRYEDLSRFQQWRRRGSQERPTDNIISKENSNCSNNNDVSDVEEYRTDSYSNSKEPELIDECENQDEDLNCKLQKELPLRKFLRSWSLENHITHVALTKLLKGLRANGHENLPCDARTLLETPTTSMISSHSGTLYHELQKAVKDHVRQFGPLSKYPGNAIKINLNVDKLPLAKSSETEMNSNALDYNPESVNDKENEGFDYDNNHEGINNKNEGFDSEFDNEKIYNEGNEDLNRETEVNSPPIIKEINIEDVHTTLHSLYEKMNISHEDFQQFKTDFQQFKTDFQQFKTEMSKNKRKIEEMLIILTEKFSNNGNEEITIDLMPDFPLTSVEEYIQFNETLRNDETIRKCFYKKIIYIGGDSIQKMISNILTYCITYEVGHKLSWTGAKNTVAIENSTFANTIIGAVAHAKEKTSDCTVTLIVKHIKNWLQHAGDKMRYRIKKVQQERERRNEN